MKLLDELSEAEITEISNLVSAFETDWARAPNRASKKELESVFALSNDQAAHYALIRVVATRVIVRAENAKGTIFFATILRDIQAFHFTQLRNFLSKTFLAKVVMSKL